MFLAAYEHIRICRCFYFRVPNDSVFFCCPFKHLIFFFKKNVTFCAFPGFSDVICPLPMRYYLIGYGRCFRVFARFGMCCFGKTTHQSVSELAGWPGTVHFFIPKCSCCNLCWTSMPFKDFDSASLPDLLPLYYRRLFPFSQYYRWLTYGGRKYCD